MTGAVSTNLILSAVPGRFPKESVDADEHIVNPRKHPSHECHSPLECHLYVSDTN
jgi:hypothetical protein